MFLQLIMIIVSTYLVLFVDQQFFFETGTVYIAQAILEHRKIPLASVSPVLGLQISADTACSVITVSALQVQYGKSEKVNNLPMVTQLEGTEPASHPALPNFRADL